MAKQKQPSKRDIALARIKFYGYHEDSAWRFYAIDQRIGLDAAREAYLNGRQARIAGVACNCMDCNPTKGN